MKGSFIKSSFFFGFLAFANFFSAHALEVPPHTGPVVDLAGLLSANEEAQLSRSLIDFQNTNGPQLQFLSVPSLEDETIESYSIKVTNAWKLGSKTKDDGVLLLVSAKERALRIEVGQGLEGTLPDALAGRIISGAIVPLFKQGHFSLGIFSGFSSIAAALGGELKDLPNFRVSRSSDKGNPFFFIIFLFVFFVLSGLFGGRRRFGRRSSGADIVTGMVLGSLLGRSGRSSGSSWGGGGGFGGGGGGGFSGGGASGRW